MFVQVIHGRVGDREALRRQMDRWNEDIKPGAHGFLGSTVGVADDGETFAIARFGSQEAARRNSDRPEQNEWWRETARVFEGEVAFHDSTDVDLMRDGGSDDATFVQVMTGRAKDVARWRELGAQGEEMIAEHRPDVIGGLTAWHEGDRFTEVVYFTTEEAARRGEKTVSELPKDSREPFEEWMSLAEGLTYTDLRQPWMTTP